jgi:hypothetical protein
MAEVHSVEPLAVHSAGTPIGFVLYRDGATACLTEEKKEHGVLSDGRNIVCLYLRVTEEILAVKFAVILDDLGDIKLMRKIVLWNPQIDGEVVHRADCGCTTDKYGTAVKP